MLALLAMNQPGDMLRIRRPRGTRWLRLERRSAQEGVHSDYMRDKQHIHEASQRPKVVDFITFHQPLADQDQPSERFVNRFVKLVEVECRWLQA